jgi:MYXO-CTERM domain-containing protein
MLENTSTDNPIWSGNTSGGIDGGGSFLEITSTKAQSSFDAGASWGDSIPDNFLFNVIGTTVVPEPSRAVLAIAGLFVLGFRRRR